MYASPNRFAVGKFQVTVNEFKAFVAATGYDASTCSVFNGKFWDCNQIVLGAIPDLRRQGCIRRLA